MKTNSFTSLIKIAKQGYSAKLFDPTLPSKTIWKIFKTLGYKDDPEILDDKFKPENVKDFFIHIIENYSPGNRQPITKDEEDKFNFRIVSEDEVCKAVTKIKSDAMMKFSSNLLKTSKTFPIIYEQAIDKPLPKKNILVPIPISILPSLSKG